MGLVGLTRHMKTRLRWNDQKLWRPKKTTYKSRMCWVTLMWSKPVQKNEQIQSWSSKKSQMLLLLPLCSEKFQWGVKTQFCQSHLQKTTRTSSLNSYFPCWLGVIGIWAKGFSKNSYLWDKNKFQAGRSISWKLSHFVDEIFHSQNNTLDQSLEATGFLRWKLRKLCCLNFN